MRGRSWMAGLTLSTSFSALLVFGTGVGLGQTGGDGAARSQAASGSRDAKEESDAKAPQNTHCVLLTLQIAGLGAEGCEVEIKPANPSCRFQTINKRVNVSGLIKDIPIKDLEIRRADRNCSFAITVKEPGQKPRTVLRGFRLAAADDPSAPAQPQKFACVLSSPSKVARLEGGTTRK